MGIVSNFGSEFDLSKYDDQILQSLKESDAMDFVALNESTETAPLGEKSQELANYLDNENGDNMEDDYASGDSDDDMDEDDGGAKADRAKLAAADDYNFDDL